MASDQRTSLVTLPYPRGDRILVILGGYPPVERKTAAHPYVLS